MSVIPVKRNGVLTGRFMVRYQLYGKRYHLGSKFESYKVGEIAEKVHRMGVEKLKNLTLDNAPIDLIDEDEHLPWQPEFKSNVLTNLLDAIADRFYKWRKDRRKQKALEQDTFERLSKMETKQVVTVFDKD